MVEQVSVTDLLRYKKRVELVRGEKILREVWVRVLGDEDLQRSYRQGRIASSKKRAALRTPGTPEYEDDIEPIPLLNTRDECINLIKQSRMNTIVGEAYANIDREEPVKLEEVAVEPDAPTLEEQETLDKKIKDQEESFQTKIGQYITEHTALLDAELQIKTDEELFDVTRIEVSNLLSLQEFQAEVMAQKVFRATYNDEKCRIRSFADIDEYRNSHTAIKDQLIQAYTILELSPDEVKN